MCCLEQHVIVPQGEEIGHPLEEITSNLYDKVRVYVEKRVRVRI